MLPDTEPLGGIVKCVLSPPTHHGQVYQHGGGNELRFPKLSDRDATGLSESNPSDWTPPWSYWNTAFIAPIRGLIIKPVLDYRNQWITGASEDYEEALGYSGRAPLHWDVASGAWVPDIVSGYGGKTWARCIGLGPGGMATIVSSYDQMLPEESSLVLYYWRWAPLDYIDVTLDDASGDVEEATTSSMVCTGITEPSNTWDYATLTFTSGVYNGVKRIVSHHHVDGGDVQIHWIGALPTPPAPGTAFMLSFSTTMAVQPSVSLTVGSRLTSPGLSVWVPFETRAAETPKPLVLSGGRVLAECDDYATAATAQDASPQIGSIAIRSIEQGAYVVSLSSGQEALIVDPNVQMAEARARVSFFAVYGACALWRQLHGTLSEDPNEGYAILSAPGQWAPWAALPGSLRIRASVPEETSVSCAMNTDASADPPTTRPQVILRTDDRTYTPVVYCVQEVHPAILTEPSTEDMTETDISEFWERWDIEETMDGRNSRARATPSIDPDIDWDLLKQNSWSQLTVAHAWPGTTSEEDLAEGAVLFTGFWDIQGYARQRDNYGQPVMTATLMPWTWRWESGAGPRKWMTLHSSISWDGWPLQEALEQILSEAGMPWSLVSWDLISGVEPEDIVIPSRRPWERAYVLEDMGVTEALDVLTRACHVHWRLRRDGGIELYHEVEYDGSTPEWTVTDTPTNTIDTVDSISVSRASDQMRNVVLHIGSNPYGTRLTRLCWDQASIGDPTAPHYIGDDWWSVVRDPANDDPGTSATRELLRRSRYQREVEWTWPGHPKMEVGAYVSIDFDEIGLTSGTVARVLSKRSTIDGNTMTYKETVRAGVLGDYDPEEL